MVNKQMFSAATSFTSVLWLFIPICSYSTCPIVVIWTSLSVAFFHIMWFMVLTCLFFFVQFRAFTTMLLSCSSWSVETRTPETLPPRRIYACGVPSPRAFCPRCESLHPSDIPIGLAQDCRRLYVTVSLNWASFYSARLHSLTEIKRLCWSP